jgi:DNA polymerase (family X)
VRQIEYSRVEIASDFRRGSELVINLPIVAETKIPSVTEDPPGGLKRAVTDKYHFGASLLHATGSAQHLELTELTHDKGFELTLMGLLGARN